MSQITTSLSSQPDERTARRPGNGFPWYAWGVLVYNLGVILWGAYVRATGSGAGCGSHWPLCNGEVIPLAPRLETIIEFIHRASSGVSLLGIALLFIWAWRSYPKGSLVRQGATLSGVFIITEALLGASLVIFGWVVRDESMGRVISMGAHLINTFLLLACLALTAWWASQGEAARRPRLRGQGLVTWALAIGLLGVLALAVSGAVNALGDTLFPAKTLAEGLAQDFSPTADILLRLRVWHPVIAVTIGLYTIFAGGLLAMFHGGTTVRRFALVLAGLFLAQLIAGIVNVMLLAPTWMQLVHLLLADSVWISFVLFSTNLLTPETV